MRRVAWLLLPCLALALAASGCASKQEVLAYYEAQVKAAQAKAAVEAARKPLLMIQAKDGEDISFTGVKAFIVYAPTHDDGSGWTVRQHKDPAYSVGTTVLGIAAGVAGLYLSGQNMVDLANAVGAHAGHNTTIGGDWTGQDKVGGNQVSGGSTYVGRDGNWNSHNPTTESAESAE